MIRGAAAVAVLWIGHRIDGVAMRVALRLVYVGGGRPSRVAVAFGEWLSGPFFRVGGWLAEWPKAWRR